MFLNLDLPDFPHDSIQVMYFDSISKVCCIFIVFCLRHQMLICSHIDEINLIIQFR